MCVVVVLGGACIAAARCSVLRWRVQPGDAGCYTDDLECCSVQSVYIYIYIYYRSVKWVMRFVALMI